MPATAKFRIADVATPLGEDVLVLTSLTGSEELGRLSEYRLEMVSQRGDITPKDILGKNVTARVELAGGDSRYINGFVTRFSELGEVVTPVYDDNRGFLYEAIVHPWLWLLTRRSDCRIFQNKKVPDIVKEVCGAYGGTIKESLSGSYEPWEYCVQYRETDFNFVSRMLEQEGIYYYFEHENGKHTLVLADGIGAHKPSKPAEVPYHETSEGGLTEADIVSRISVVTTIQPGRYAVQDFNPLKPKVNLAKDAPISREHDFASFELYDYPGEYEETAEGTTYARARVEEVQTQHRVFSGAATVRSLSAGQLMTLTDHPLASYNKKFLITSVNLRITNNELQTGGGSGAEFSLAFSAIESKEQFRALRITPKPVVQGAQTAIVVGPKGEEIHVDKYGRVKVHFHWDRLDKADENSSCWVRVASPWAGKSWGMINHPRIGQEVIVDFLEGDPDRPIITGRVYNDDCMPPYTLPDEKTKSTIKSLSSKGGGGFNELRFEDKKGEEQIFIHGEKNLDVRIKNDRMEFIGNDRHLIVTNDRFDHVKANRHLTVDADDMATVKGNQSLKVEGDRMEEIGGSDSLKVKGDQKAEVTGDTNLKSGKNHNHKVGQKYSLDVGQEIHAKAGMKIAAKAGMDVHIKGGMTVVIEAGMQLSLKVGGNFIDINPGGVFIKGAMVMINSGGSAGSASDASPGSPAAPDAPDPPTAPKEADKAEPGKVTQASATPVKPKKEQLSWTKYTNPQAKALKDAADSGAPFCEKCEEAKKQQSGGGAA